MDTTSTTTTQATNTFEMVFSMGLPAAGKSYMAAIEYPGHDTIDPDAIKESHPAYDANDPAALHSWSQDITETLFTTAIENPSSDMLIDGTGTNAEKMVRRIKAAAAAGYSTTLMFVTCDLSTSLARNADRERHVPENIIRSKALDVETAFEIISAHVDTVRVIENN